MAQVNHDKQELPSGIKDGVYIAIVAIVKLAIVLMIIIGLLAVASWYGGEYIKRNNAYIQAQSDLINDHKADIAAHQNKE
jgi:hypothetical protein